MSSAVLTRLCGIGCFLIPVLLLAGVNALVALAPGHDALVGCTVRPDDSRGMHLPSHHGPWLLKHAVPWRGPNDNNNDDAASTTIHGAIHEVVVPIVSETTSCRSTDFARGAVLLACVEMDASDRVALPSALPLDQWRRLLHALLTSDDLGIVAVCPFADGNKHHRALRSETHASPFGDGIIESPLQAGAPITANVTEEAPEGQCVDATLSHPVTHASVQRLFEGSVNDHAGGFPMAFAWAPVHESSRETSAPAVVRVCGAQPLHRGRLTDALRMSHLVVHIGAVHRARPLNKWVRGQLESGQPAREPFTAAGLTGSGVVIGVTDTGIDTDHCFFHDPAHDIPYRAFDPRHRKIVRYTPASYTGSGAKGDFNEGHGTHVAGTLAGSVLPAVAARNANASNAAAFHGMAPDAKLTFTDVSSAGESIDHLPLSLVDMFKTAYSDGARVHSNSWGDVHADYTTLSRDVDIAANTLKDMLMVFAVGNDADAGCQGQDYRKLQCDRFSVMSPSTAKNALSVGASMGVMESWVAANHGNFRLVLGADGTSSGPAEIPAGSDIAQWAATGARAYRAEFGTQTDIGNATLALSAEPYLGCGSEAPSRLRGKVAVFLRGTCKFGLKAQHAERAGAVAVIIVNNEDGDPIIMGQDKDTPFAIGIPAFMIGKQQGKQLMAFLKHVSPVLVTGRVVADNSPDTHKDPDNLSSFSSHGPTRDLRYKPDLVGVGEFVHSARSDASLTTHNCDVWASMGTSMATPAVAGMAVLVQEYFTRGFYPGGFEGSGPALTLRSDTAKAILIHAALPLRGLFDRNSHGDWQRLGATPSFEQGHGALRINSSLPLRSNASTQHVDSQPQLVVRQNASAVTGDRETLCVRYRPASGDSRRDPFRAVLAWIDPASSPAAQYHLINDLDLHVELPDGREFFGNRRRQGGARAIAADRLNNVERVFVEDAPEGVYRVTVSGASTTSRQDYSLAISGESAPCSSQVCDDARCQAHGTCSTTGECRCQAGWRGQYCDVPLGSLAAGVTLRASVEPMEWRGFVLPLHVTPRAQHVVLTMQTESAAGDPNLYLQFNTMPEPFRRSGTYSHKLDQCDSCKRTMGSRLPHAQTLSFRVERDVTAYIAMAGMCCSRAEFTLNVSVDTCSATPFVTRAALFTSEDENPRVIVTPSDIAMTVVAYGSFDPAVPTFARLGPYVVGNDSVPCVLEAINATALSCIVSKDDINTVCGVAGQDNKVTLYVQQGRAHFRTVSERAIFSCVSLTGQEAKTPDGKPVHRVRTALVNGAAQPVVDRLSGCKDLLLANSAAADMAGLRNVSAALDCVAASGILDDNTESAAVAQQLQIPHGALKYGDVIALEVHSAASILPPEVHSWWPQLPTTIKAVHVSLVNTDANLWYRLRHVRVVPGGLLAVVGADDGEESVQPSTLPSGVDLAVAIGVHAAGADHARWGIDTRVTVRILPRPSGVHLALVAGAEYRDGLPRQPYAASMMNITVFVEGRNLGPIGDGAALSLGFGQAQRKMVMRFEPLFASTSSPPGHGSASVPSDRTEAGSAGKQIAGYFASSVFPCGQPLVPTLGRNSSLTMFGYTLAELTDDVLSFHCPSRVTGVARHVPYSHHAFLDATRETLTVEVFGSFAEIPQTALLKLPDGATVTLTVSHWAATGIAMTVAADSAQTVPRNVPLGVTLMMPSGQIVSIGNAVDDRGRATSHALTVTFVEPNATAAVTSISSDARGSTNDRAARGVTLPTVTPSTLWQGVSITVTGLALDAAFLRDNRHNAIASGRVVRVDSNGTVQQFLHATLSCSHTDQSPTGGAGTSNAALESYNCPVQTVRADQLTCQVNPLLSGTCTVGIEVRSPHQPGPVFDLVASTRSTTSPSTAVLTPATISRGAPEVANAGQLEVDGGADFFVAGRSHAVTAQLPSTISSNGQLAVTLRLAAGHHEWPVAHRVCAASAADELEATTAWPTALLGEASGDAGNTALTFDVSGAAVLRAVTHTAEAGGWASDDELELTRIPAALVGCVRPSSSSSASAASGNVATPFALPTTVRRVLVLRSLSVVETSDHALNAQALLAASGELPVLRTDARRLSLTLVVNPTMHFGAEGSRRSTARLSLWRIAVKESSRRQTAAAATTLCQSATSRFTAVAMGTVDADSVHGNATFETFSGHAATTDVVLCLAVADVDANAPASRRGDLSHSVAVASLNFVACTSTTQCGGKGTCDVSTKSCSCAAAVRGRYCETACPVRATDGAVCHGHGFCDDSGACRCYFGYAGEACTASVLPLAVWTEQSASRVQATLRVSALSPAMAEPQTAAEAESRVPAWRMLNVHDYTGADTVELDVRLGPLQYASSKGLIGSPADAARAWIDVYQWCDAASIGRASRARVQYELAMSDGMSFGTGGASTTIRFDPNCHCFVPLHGTTMPPDTAGISANGTAIAVRGYCLGVYVSATSVPDDVASRGALTSVLTATATSPLGTDGGHGGDTSHPPVVAPTCGTPCMSIRAALALFFAAFGGLLGYLLTRRCG